MKAFTFLSLFLIMHFSVPCARCAEESVQSVLNSISVTTKIENSGNDAALVVYLVNQGKDLLRLNANSFRTPKFGLKVIPANMSKWPSIAEISAQKEVLLSCSVEKVPFDIESPASIELPPGKTLNLRFSLPEIRKIIGSNLIGKSDGHSSDGFEQFVKENSVELQIRFINPLAGLKLKKVFTSLSAPYVKL